MKYPEYLHDKTIAVWDIEADWIPSTIIYCISVAIVKNGILLEKAKVFTYKWTPYSQGALFEAIQLINACDYHCGHNIIGYDVQMVRKLLLTDITPRPLDTLILAKIIFSKDDLYAMDPNLGIDKDLYGSYSAKAFGQRMNDFKIDYTDFSHLNEEMAIYCNQDTDLTAKLLIFLMDKENFPIEAVVDIEHKAADIIAQQTEQGFYLDIDMARKLNTDLLQEKGELSRKLLDIFHPKFMADGPVKSYKKQSIVKKYLPNNHYIPLIGTKDD